MIKRLFLFLIKFYQSKISPLFGEHCRFYPSCSQYCYAVIEKHGTLKGIALGVKRIFKCNPFFEGGIDLP